MGASLNFCDHNVDARGTLEAELPMKELFDGYVLEEKVDSGPKTPQIIARALSVRSCLHTQTQHSMEIPISDEDYSKSVPDCLLPMEAEDSADEDELDFSKDRELYDKRTPAVFLGMDAKTGTARYEMPSPARASTNNVELPRLPSVGGSFFVAPKRGAQSSTQLQRSNSSCIMTSTAMRTLPRSDSSYVYTTTLSRSESSCLPTNKAVRSQSAPPGPSSEQRRIPSPTGPLVEELQLDSIGWPDPSIKALREKVYAALGVREPARIESMQGFIGGQNQGMWVLVDGKRTLILKLVEGKRKHRLMPTEAEQFMKLAEQHPAIRSDATLAFPIKVFLCRDANGNRHHDLIVMHKAPGRCLAEAIAQKARHKNLEPQLMQLFEALGRFLAGIHNRYNMQHGDLQPSNIFHDESTGYFTLIDVGGMDNTPVLLDSDVEHFAEALRMLAHGLQAHELFTDACRQFHAGYAAVKS